MNPESELLKEKYPSAWRWIRVSRRIAGWLTDGEANGLFELALNTTPSRDPVVVELGSWQGKSSVLLGAALRKKKNPRLFCVDPFGVDENAAAQKEYYEDLIRKMRISLEDAFRRNIKRCGLSDIVVPVKGYSYGVVRLWKEPIDLLFIDASHNYESVHRDFLLWAPFVKIGGVIAMHDVSPNWEGPSRVMAEDMQPPQFGDVHQVDSLAWAVKRSNEPLSSRHNRVVITIPKIDFDTRLREISRLRKDLEDALGEVNRLAQSLSESESLRQQADSRLKEFGSQNAALLEEKDRLSRALSESGALRDEADRRAAQWASENQSLREESTRLAQLFSESEFSRGRLESELSEAAGANRSLECAVLKSQQTVQRLEQELDHAAKRLASAQQSINAIRSSWSWRVTGPLRGLLGVIRLATKKPAGILQVRRLAGFAQWAWFAKQVRKSGLFDEEYYRECNPDVSARMDPLMHFFVFGACECRNPHPLFDVRYYTTSNPDVAGSRVNPLLHYLKWGAYEGRDPHPAFDSTLYLSRNPEVREAGLNPLAHYLALGIVQGRHPTPAFDTPAHPEKHAELGVPALNPLVQGK
jgi:predicted O-methyltransferase YrrM